MHWKIPVRRPSAGTVLGGLALIVATSGVAVAANPGGDGAVTACVTKGGAVKLIDAEQGQTCPGNQTTIKLASADAAGKVADADLLDGKDSTEYLGASAKAADANLLDGKDFTEFLGAGALPGKTSRHFEAFEIPAGATKGVAVSCPDKDAVAVGGGAHWGINPSHSQEAEHITGILNASTLAAAFGWGAVATNDEAGPLWLRSRWSA